MVAASFISSNTPNVINPFQKVVTGTAQNLPYSLCVNGILIKALPTNQGTIFVGDKTVNTTLDGTGTGFPLVPGEEINVAIANYNVLWVIATVPGDIIACIGN